MFTLKQRAIFALCIVALSYTILTVAVRLLNTGFEPFTQVYLRIGLGFLLTTVIFYKKIRWQHILRTSKRDWLFLLLMGTFGYGIAVDFVTLGALHTKLLNVAVISSTTPFFIFLFSIIFFRRAFRSFLLLFLLATFYGVFILATRSLVPAFNEFGIGDFYVLLFAIGLGIYIFGRKMLSSHLNTVEISAVVMGIAFVSSFLSALFVKEQLSFAGFLNPIALLGLVLGGALNLVATTLETFAFRHINAVAGSQLLLLENVFAPIFGFVLYHEILLPVELFGALLVVSGVWCYVRFGED